MKIIYGALAVVTALVCPGLAEASDDGRLRGKISTLHANAAEKRFMTRPRRKIPPAVSDTAARVPAALHASAAEKMFTTRPRRKIPPAVVKATARGPAVSAHGTKTKTASKAEEHHLDDAYVGLKEDSAVGSLKDMATYSPTGVPVPTATPLCDWATEELCYDGALFPDGTCVAYADGGCPCPEGEVKCGADDDWSGYCTTVCCDSETEVTCIDDDYNRSCAAYADGCPCPEGEDKCGADDDYPGYCTDACCDSETEETCYDDDYNAQSCVAWEDGGCPCPEGEEKCNGLCKYEGELCCDSETEETCYDDDYNKLCAANADGGCPCPEGEEKCGANDFWVGYCTAVCCDSETEETCYNDYYNAQSCVAWEDGGCPSFFKTKEAVE